MPQSPVPAAPEPSPTPAEWNSHLCNELVIKMTDAARYLVAVLAASGADGVTRESLTAQLDIAEDTICRKWHDFLNGLLPPP